MYSSVVTCEGIRFEGLKKNKKIGVGILGTQRLELTKYFVGTGIRIKS